MWETSSTLQILVSPPKPHQVRTIYAQIIHNSTRATQFEHALQGSREHSHLHKMYSHYYSVYCFFKPAVFDFTLELYSVTVPATEDDVGTTSTFGVAAGITVREDNVDELKQSFALVALIGDSVADNVTCFKMSVGDTQCFGRAGATRIEISDQGRQVSDYGNSDYNSCVE